MALDRAEIYLPCRTGTGRRAFQAACFAMGKVSSRPETSAIPVSLAEQAKSGLISYLLRIPPIISEAMNDSDARLADGDR